jgi:hypothetical protein
MSDQVWGSGTIYQKTFTLWHYGIVISIDDPYVAGRIRVRIEGVDNDISQSNELLDPDKGGLPWCQPLMPKFINVVPIVGETVKVAVFDFRNKKIRREYIGPVISQQRPPELLKSPFFPNKWRVEVGNYNGAWTENPESLDGSWKIYPDKEDIALLGRRNTDIILRNKSEYDEIILRAGKIDYKDILDPSNSTNNGSVLGGNFKLNKVNPAYITINHTLPQTFTSTNEEDATKKKLNLDDDRTHINVVADKINLISHEGSSIRGYAPAILKGDDVLTQLKTENDDLHPLPYGDVLWDFMTKMRAFVEGHIHPYSGLPPDPSLVTSDLITWFNNNMGKKTTKKNLDGTPYIDIDGCTFLSRGVKTN